MNIATFCDPITISRLKDKQGYELWLLEFLKQNSPFKSRDIDDSVIKPDGSITRNIVFSDRLSDERAHEIINTLSPLIFTTTYKLIDSIFEWILEEHEIAGIIDRVPWPFTQKIELVHELQMSNSFILPKLLIDEPNLFTIIFSLYEKLLSFRNSIVHDFSFKLQTSTLEITNRNNQTIHLSPEELFAFSHASVLVSKSLQGLPVNIKVWRDIKSHLDIIQKLHGNPKFGLAKPSGIRFIQFAERIVNTATNANEWKVNVYFAWDSITKRYPGGEIEDFELRIWGKRGDGSLVSWLIPSEVLEGLIFFTVSENDYGWNRFRMDINKDEVDPPITKNVLAHKMALENKIKCPNCPSYSVLFLAYNSNREEGYYQCKRCDYKFSESINIILG